MVVRNVFFITGLLLALVIPLNSAQAESARFLTVIDGDSLRVESKGRTREVRLIGIDAPEWGQEYGTQAKSYAMTLCYGQALRLEFDKERRDRYGRLLAYVYCGDKMLNEEMVGAGYAIAIKVSPNDKYYKRLKRAESQARTKRKGFWLRGGLKTPAEWRKRNK